MVHSSRPSLESLVEKGDIALEILHPGGLVITRELAELCHVTKGSKVLDVASGTGESVFYLAETFGCQTVGVDLSDYMVRRAQKKAQERNLETQFIEGDAHCLPFGSDVFDAVLSECTVCLLEKDIAIGEMARVARPGGYVGIHDICWKEDTPQNLKERLAEIEGERPETIDGWKVLFERAGLVDIRAVEKSHLLRAWTREIKGNLGSVGLLKIGLNAVKTWGIAGLKNILESERIFRNSHTGYAIIAGRKPP